MPFFKYDRVQHRFLDFSAKWGELVCLPYLARLAVWPVEPDRPETAYDVVQSGMPSIIEVEGRLCDTQEFPPFEGGRISSDGSTHPPNLEELVRQRQAAGWLIDDDLWLALGVDPETKKR